MTIVRPKYILTLAIMIGACAVAWLLLASRGSVDRAGASISPPTVADHFAVLRDGAPATLSPAAGTGLSRALASASAAGNTGSGAGSTTYAGVSSGPIKTYIVSGGGLLCNVIVSSETPGPTVGCGPATPDFAARDLAISVTRTDSGFIVSGLAPDGTRAAAVKTASDQSVPLTIENNSFAVSVDQAPSGISWTDGSGNTHTTAPTDPTR